ncbi:muramidase family protein [Anaerophilus nitritogenes]|uniref:muramidase family protein n=1 Tax=Anaerophilus nitritogenes TaxID=2498136 RepID=UPI0013EBB311|nr:LysM peptidoglycan-binding domain-containing protein [Anaerophilus nitritogenes]
MYRSCPTGTISYVVKPGDSLYAIAKKYNTTVEYLVFLNGLKNPNNLQVGEGLCVPMMPNISCPTGSYYTIKYGDTLYKIAKEYNISVNEIIRLNPYLNPYHLMVGQVICIPKKTISCPSGKLYTIEDGDTFFKIATKFDISYELLKTSNPNLDVDHLVVGEQICIPKSKPSLTCPENKTYIIQPGESLSSVAEKFVVGANELLKANPNMITSEFAPGRLICIPTKQADV